MTPVVVGINGPIAVVDGVRELIEKRYDTSIEADDVMGPLELATKMENMAVILAENVPQMEPGEVSEPLVSDYTIYVVRLDGKSAGEQVPFEEVVEDVKADLTTQRHAEAKRRLLKDLRAEADIEWKPEHIDFRVPEGAGDDIVTVESEDGGPRLARGWLARPMAPSKGSRCAAATDRAPWRPCGPARRCGPPRSRCR